MSDPVEIVAASAGVAPALPVAEPSATVPPRMLHDLRNAVNVVMLGNALARRAMEMGDTDTLARQLERVDDASRECSRLLGLAAPPRT